MEEKLTVIEVDVKTPVTAGYYELHLLVKNPPTMTAPGTKLGTWKMESYIDRFKPLILDHAAYALGFVINGQMPMGGIITGNLCLKEAIKTCPVVDQQYQKTGRNDQPGALNNLIFTLTLSAESQPGPVTVRAPPGFTFLSECTVITDSNLVFGEFNMLPTQYQGWPDGVVEATKCVGKENVATFQLLHPPSKGLMAGKQYVFRINSVTNPMEIGIDNAWVVEFNRQSSTP